MPRIDLPARASDSGPIDNSASMDARDYIDLAIEALESALRSDTATAARSYLAIADDRIQDAQQKLKQKVSKG